MSDVVLTAGDAQPGDVVMRKADGQVYVAPPAEGVRGWSAAQPLPFLGPPEATAPDGELILLARRGSRVRDDGTVPGEAG